MRTLCILVVSIVLLAPSAGMGVTVTVGPGDPDSLFFLWYGNADTIRMLPGTYVVDEPSGRWPLVLGSGSPALVGVGGPEGVILLGTGVERAFFLGEFVWDAHIHFERLTFSELGEVIARVSPISGAGGELHFTDNIVEDCGTGPAWPGLRTTGCWGIIARNVFRNNHGCGIETYHTSAAIEDNEIYGNRGGIWDQCCQSPPTRRNHIHDNSGTAIRTGYWIGGILEHNVIERNGGTGISMGHTGTVQYNVIRENAIGVAGSSWCGAAAALHYNDIYDNAEANLKVTTDTPQTWDCTLNWWGSTDPAVISQGIWDCYDDPEVVTCVVFEPFCMSPGCEPVPVEPSSWGSIKALYRR